MKVSVFGLGHVGSVTAACLARAGHHVIAVDRCPATAERFGAGRGAGLERGLGEVVAEMTAAGRLTVTTDVADAVRRSDLGMICVGVPAILDGEPDAAAFDAVAGAIGSALVGRDRPFTAVLRSTVLPGTTESVLIPALRRAAGTFTQWKVAMHPAFLREGTALGDWAQPPLVLVGCNDLGTAALMRDLYADVAAPFVETSIRTAELVKFSSVAFHSLKVCFANEMGNLCEAIGADAREVMRIFAMDRKLNMSDAYLRPGFAFGGARFSKDVRALLWMARDRQVDLPLLSAILPSNDQQIRAAVEMVLRTGRRHIGVVGLTCTPSDEQLASCPLMSLVEALIDHHCDVRVFDRDLARLRRDLARAAAGGLRRLVPMLCDDVSALVDHADVLVIGRATDDALRALGLAGPDCVVVDLTRGAVFEACDGLWAAAPAGDAPAVRR